MNFRPAHLRLRWTACLALVLFAAFFIPMSPSITDVAVARADEPAAATSKTPKTRYPIIVKTVPQIGETGVDPDLKEIRVTFDRDMGKGMSWTGGPPNFPPTSKSKRAKWIDDRTCVMPVLLESGNYYRVGINSTSYQNFQSADGIAARPSAIYFTTKGSIDDRVRVPSIVSLSPANGATKVSSDTKALSVTFDMPMGDGMSWCSTDELHQGGDDEGKATWSEDRRTCTLPVSLTADREYELSLNSVDHINFQSTWGVPLVPVAYKFRTVAAK